MSPGVCGSGSIPRPSVPRGTSHSRNGCRGWASKGRPWPASVFTLRPLLRGGRTPRSAVIGPWERCNLRVDACSVAACGRISRARRRVGVSRYDRSRRTVLVQHCASCARAVCVRLGGSAGVAPAAGDGVLGVVVQRFRSRLSIPALVTIAGAPFVGSGMATQL
jgi:hypothetical protein